MSPVFFLLLTFFAGGSWSTHPMTCPNLDCVERVVEYGAANSRELYRVRVYKEEPSRTRIGNEGNGSVIDPPLRDYWLQ